VTAITERLRFLSRRLSERLWVRPLVVCLLSNAAILAAKLADLTNVGDILPNVTAESIEMLLAILGASMLGVATFAVASMVAAYASASTAATPRSFSLVIADDVSQNALSTFIGAFIFSVVALTAMKNEYFEPAGRAAIFGLTVVVFAAVVLTLVRWVDRIARLGRLGSSIEKVEAAATDAIRRRKAAPTLRGVPARRQLPQGQPVYARSVGYVQRVDVATLQNSAETAHGWISVTALPGTFATPGRPLAYVGTDDGETGEIDDARIASAFVIGTERRFDDDPRFGLVVLAEIAAKALSPGINDSGTAIAIIGSLARLFVLWAAPVETAAEPLYDRVEVPELSVRDMFDDAFMPIARDGAGAVEVIVRLQKALASLAVHDDASMPEAARAHARMALARAELEMDLPEDLSHVRDVSTFALK